MATTIDTNIIQKYLTNVKVASDVISGIEYDKQLDQEIIAELEATDLSIEDLIDSRLQTLKESSEAFITNVGEVDKSKIAGLKEYTTIPKILDRENVANNRLVELSNGDNLFISTPSGINEGLFIYKLNEDEGSLTNIFFLETVSEEEDVRKMISVDLIDIIWNTKELAYQIFWVSAGDQKIRTSIIKDKQLSEIEIITNNTSEKSGRLRSNMNDDGDIVVFTSSKASDGYYYGIVVSKERSLNSWQTTDLLSHIAKKSDYGSFGRVQIVGADFFYIYSNSSDRLYFVRITNSDNQLITSTVSENSKLTNPTCMKYFQYDSASGTTDYYIVATIENDVPRVVKVQNDLIINTLDKMPTAGSYRSPYVLTKEGVSQLTNRFTRNFGEQWTENQLDNYIGTSNIESQKYIIIQKDNKLTILVDIEKIVKFNEEFFVK